jgi:hypothetical protein
MNLTITTNPWTLPSEPVYLEGRPSREERARDRARAEAERRVWQPGPDAFALLERLRPFIGAEVVIQAWDSIMLFLDDEGPFPIVATCTDVLTRPDPTGHLRAYLALRNPAERRTPRGSSVLSELVEDGDGWLFGVDRLYSIETIEHL